MSTTFSRTTVTPIWPIAASKRLACRPGISVSKVVGRSSSSQAEHLGRGADDVDFPADDLALVIAEVIRRRAECHGDGEGPLGLVRRDHLDEVGHGMFGERRVAAALGVGGQRQAEHRQDGDEIACELPHAWSPDAWIVREVTLAAIGRTGKQGADQSWMRR